MKRRKILWFSSVGAIVSNSKKLKFVSSIRCGFDFSKLDEIYSRLQMKIGNVAFDVTVFDQ
ncbi:MAG TPA: hypothetical protein VI278_15415 [Nitrososphaeraceae archaeon]